MTTGHRIRNLRAYKWPIIAVVGMLCLIAVHHSQMRSVLSEDENIIDNERRTVSLQKPTQTPISDEGVAERFRKRLRHLREECKKDTRHPLRHEWKANSNFLVDVPAHLLICAVPKSGSTAWHRTIWAMRRARAHMSVDQKLYTPQDTIRNQGIAAKLPPADGKKLITKVTGDDNFLRDPPPNSSFRIILARHPFARLISGWNQKFLLKSNYWTFLFKNYPRLIDYKKKIDENRVMAFSDFAQYVAENGLAAGSLDFHFMPAAHCQPCEYDYTYILKAESVDVDEKWLFKRLNITDFNVGRKGVPPGGSAVNNDVKGNIKKFMSTLTPDVVQRLYKVYALDFQYFGYTFNFTTLEAGGFD